MAAKKAPKTSKSKADSKAKTPGKRGGARPGAGRPRKEISKLKAENNLLCAETVAEWTPELLLNHKRLAMGGYKRVTRTREPAGLIMIDVQAEGPAVDDDGNPILKDGEPVMRPLYTANGSPLMIKARAFPDVDPNKLITVSEKVETADGDRAAGEYLINRGAGKPTDSIELSGKDGEPLPSLVVVAIDKVYGAAPSEPEGDR